MSSSSSEDDMPLLGRRKPNDVSSGSSPLSDPKSVGLQKPVNGKENGNGNGTSNANGNGNVGDLQPGASLKFAPQNGAEDVEMRDALISANGTKRSASPVDENSSSDDDVPLSKRRRTSPKPAAAKAKSESSSDSDVPVAKKLAAVRAKIEKQQEQDSRDIVAKESAASAKKLSAPRQRKPAVKEEEPSSSDDDVPLAKKKKVAASAKAKPSATRKKAAATATTAKSGAKTRVKKEEVKEESISAKEESTEEGTGVHWWENPDAVDDSIKWTTLEHNGVVFPPPYEALPSDVKLFYDGRAVNLPIEAEEVATFFGCMLNSTANVENPVFQKNFFNDFRAVLKKSGGAKDPKGNKVDIKDFKKCDFTRIFEHYDTLRKARNARPAAEKKKEREKKEEVEAPYKYCIWDGKKQQVGNFHIEPPGLFRGRGEHPKTGKVKQRVRPEQITINIGKEAKVPPPPEGHRWKEIKHDQKAAWLASWQENINGDIKYVQLAANSDVKGKSDYKKFEKARELKKHIDRIRKDYYKKLSDQSTLEAQKATALYLIDKFALRAGNEKGEDEADTAGCCSLKFEHVTLKPPNIVVFDFLGKDSIRYYDEVEVDPKVFRNLKIFKKKPKTKGDDIFDRLTTASLNKHLQNYMPGLTAKVFRTYNASYTMATLLKDIKVEGSLAERVKAYNNANRQVAILCNHKRTVTAGHAGQMEKLSDRIKGMRYKQWRYKQMMLDIEPKEKKKRGAEFFEVHPDLTREWIKEHQAALVEEEKLKIKKKFEKENEKRVGEGEKQLPEKELNERLKAAGELKAKFKKENSSGKVEVEGRGTTIERLEANIEKLQQRIETELIRAEDKENNKEVALGTSKINYIDPRLTVVFAKKFNVPLEKLFNKSLRDKFDWALKSVNEDWEF